MSPGYNVLVTVSSGPVQVTLLGQIYKPEADAKTAIQAAGLVYGQTTTDYSPSVPAGQVIGVLVPGSTTPNGGNLQVTKGTKVDLVVSNGLVQMPDVRGQAAVAARDLLSGSAYGLTVKLVPTTACTGQKVTAPVAGHRRRAAAVDGHPDLLQRLGASPARGQPSLTSGLRSFARSTASASPVVASQLPSIR